MTRYTQKSFTGGVLSPSLYSRNDLAKYAIGLKTLKNGFVCAEGCVSNRAGLELVCEVKDSSKKVKLIPFSFNTEQTYVLEMGGGYARFIKEGAQIIYPKDSEKAGQIVELEMPYSSEEILEIKYAQNADVLTICNKNHSPSELSRLSHYDWKLTPINFEPLISAPINVKATWKGDSDHKIKYTYVVTAVKANTFEESNCSKEVVVKGQMEAYWGTDEYITITFDAVEGAVEYNVYRMVNGVFGYVGTTTTNSFTDDKIEPDLSSTAPIFTNPFENGNNPACVNYYQQRKIYACLKNNPQQLVTSQTGTNNNFNVSRPLSPSDSIDITLSEREVNEIRHILALNDMVLLTSGAEWKLNGSDGSFSATSSIVASPQSFYGSSQVAPVVSGNMILYVQSGGSVVRDLGYTYLSDSYDGEELSIFANHLFEGKQVVDMAYSKEPYRILWCVMSDGSVNALTYNKKQEVSAWHQHITKGKFEAVTVIREGFEDIPYFVVNRTINGQTRRYIERMASRIVEKTSDGVFLDSSLKYEGKPTKQLSGLSHLEGEIVNVLADGGLETGIVVKEGKIQLQYPASKIIVGIPYEFELQTLRLEGENTYGLLKIVNEVNIFVEKSREDFFLVGIDSSLNQNSRSIKSINDVNFLYSGDVSLQGVYDYSQEASVHIKQIYPFPLTINSISLDVTLADVNE